MICSMKRNGIYTMTQKYFSKKEALARGWDQVAQHFWSVMAVMAIGLVAMGASAIIRVGADKGMGEPAALVIDVAVLVFQWFVSLGLMKIYLSLADGGKRPKIEDLFLSGSFLWRYIGASLVYMGIVIGGLILLVVPGIVWAIKYRLYGYFILDKRVNAMESLRLSGQATKGSRWNLFLLIILTGLINLVGVLVFGVGLLVTIPVGGIAVAYTYRVLEKRLAAPEKSSASDSVGASA